MTLLLCPGRPGRGPLKWPAILAAGWIALASSIALPVMAGVPNGTAQAEIAQLLALVERSGCRFERNGKWYDSKAAREHLERKERYLEEHGQVARAEDFIEKAATRSSVTGEPYRVQCGSSPAVPSADWFRAELARLRASQ